MIDNKHYASVFFPCLALAVLLILFLATGWDKSVFLSINQSTQWLPDTFWQILCTLSDPISAFLLVFVIFYKHGLFVRALVISGCFAIIANYSLKYGFGFSRPHEVLNTTTFYQIGPAMTSPSFPSGHTLTIFTLMSLLSHWSGNARLTMSLFVLALFMSVSRVAVGAHWPSDVLFGALIGWFIGWVAIQVNQRLGDTVAPRLLLGLYFLGLLTGIFSVIKGTHYPAGLWLSTAIALFTVAYSLRSITELLHRQKG